MEHIMHSYPNNVVLHTLHEIEKRGLPIEFLPDTTSNLVKHTYAASGEEGIVKLVVQAVIVPNLGEVNENYTMQWRERRYATLGGYLLGSHRLENHSASLLYESPVHGTRTFSLEKPEFNVDIRNRPVVSIYSAVNGKPFYQALEHFLDIAQRKRTIGSLGIIQ